MQDRFNSAKAWLQAQFVLQQESVFLWLPVFFGVGIALYFSLLFEPALIWGIVPVTISVLAVGLLKSYQPGRLVFIFMFFIAVGFLAGQIRTQLAYTPIIAKKLDPAKVTGTIISIDALAEGKGGRYMLTDLAVENLSPDLTPRKIRLTIRKNEGLQIGQPIELLAALNPPSPPIMPGAFDFQRYMYFQGIGAIGFGYTQPKILQEAASGFFSSTIEKIRNKIDHVIENALPPTQAPIAKALITGKRGAIDKEDDNAIKNAGLYHILSISGLHITLFATIIFFTSRFLMACFPSFALRYPIKKYAAVLGFVMALFYTLLSGSEVPAERSLIMLGAAFLAIILDRDPLSPRLLSFAALIILLLTPESLMSISFQMSFSAVMAMIFFYDWQRPRFSKWYSNAGPFKKISLYFAGIALTTILATFATAPFTIFHFQNLALYGVIANAIVIPMIGFILMPAAVIALFLMPLGFAYIPLQFVGFGVAGMTWIAHWIDGFPHATLNFSSWPAAAFIIMIISLLLVTLWQGRLKVIFLIPLIISVIWIANYRQPDILISPRFDLVAIRGEDGLLLSTKRKEKFIRENWERMIGFRPGSSLAWPKEGSENDLSCDPSACRLEENGKKISFLKKAQAASVECSWADMVLAFEPLKTACETLVIDKFDALNNGAYAIWLEKNPLIRNVEDGRGIRPWNTHQKKYQ